jgi:hypothetical protein
VWQGAVVIGGAIFGGHGICGSLTFDCSDQRIVDAYEIAKAYHDILADVTAEYANIAEGSASQVVTVGGQSVGGAVKAAGVLLDFSEAPWVYKFKDNQISCCDCFHPSFRGQNTAARILFDGFTCNATDVCCADAGNSLGNGRCTAEDTSGTFYPGLF